MTIYDIAKKAEVSISSVSRYYNHPEMLSPEIQKRISRVLEESDYIPNQLARGLVLNSAKSIGVMMSDMQHQRFSMIASNLEQAFFEWGYNTLFCNTGDDWRKMQQYLYMLSARRIDALVLIGSVFGSFDVKSMLLKYFPEGLPVITSDLDLDMPNNFSVTPDHNYGMLTAVKHLIDRGHKDLAFVACTNSLNTNRKIDAFHRALSAYDLPFFREDNILQLFFSAREDPNLDVAAIVKESGIPYTCLIFSHDQIAARAVGSLQYHGYRVPDDYAVIGYDNSPYSLCSQPPLTTIDTKAKTIARVIANQVNDIFNDRDVGSRVIIKPTLVVRSST